MLEIMCQLKGNMKIDGIVRKQIANLIKFKRRRIVVLFYRLIKTTYPCQLL